MRLPGSGPARALVVGVYPSAFHIAWSPPADHDPRPPERRSRPFIGSLAVDVEPVVFWNGTAPMPAEELMRWKAAVSFDDHRHGAAAVGHNGPTGFGVVKDVLGPLGLDAADVAFTDVVPWFFVKGGTGCQGAAIDERFNPVAAKLDLRAGQPPFPAVAVRHGEPGRRRSPPEYAAIRVA